MKKITASTKRTINKKFKIATTVLDRMDSFVTYEINYRVEQLEVIGVDIYSDIIMFPEYAFLTEFYSMYVTYDHSLKKCKMIIF